MHISPRAEADMAMKEEGSEHQEEAKPIPPHPTSGEHQTRELIMPQPPRRRPPVALRHTTWLRHSQLEWLIPRITPRLGLGVGETSWVLLYLSAVEGELSIPRRGSSYLDRVHWVYLQRVSYQACTVLSLQPRQQITLSASHPHSTVSPSLPLSLYIPRSRPPSPGPLCNLCAFGVSRTWSPPPHDPHHRYTLHDCFRTHFSPPTGASPAATPPRSVLAVLGAILN